MGSDISVIPDNGINNLLKCDILKIYTKKDYYFENQLLEGTVIVEPRENLVLNDICLRLKSGEYFIMKKDEKHITSDVKNEKIFEERMNINQKVGNKNENDIVNLGIGTYKFEFKIQLPRELPPSFEYPCKSRRAALRYTLSAEIISPNFKGVTENYIWIKQRPILLPIDIKTEHTSVVKKIGLLSRGRSSIAIFTITNNYRLGDFLPFTVDVNNLECQLPIQEFKVSVKRTVTFNKKGTEYPDCVTILRKVYPCKIPAFEKNSFHYEDIQLGDAGQTHFVFNEKLNPYPVVSDINQLLPTMKSKLIKCEYQLKVTSYFDPSVLKGSRPRVVIPLVLSHQLRDEFDTEKREKQLKEEEKQRSYSLYSQPNRGMGGFGGNYNNNFNNNNFNNNNFNNNNFNNNNNYNNNYNNNNNNNNYGNNQNYNRSQSSNTGNNNNNYDNINSGEFSYENYIKTRKANTVVSNNSNNNSYGNNNPYENYDNNPYSNNNNNPYENFDNNNNDNSYGNNNKKPYENNNNNPYDSFNNNPYENYSNNYNNNYNNNNNNFNNNSSINNYPNPFAGMNNNYGNNSYGGNNNYNNNFNNNSNNFNNSYNNYNNNNNNNNNNSTINNPFADLDSNPYMNNNQSNNGEGGDYPGL